MKNLILILILFVFSFCNNSGESDNIAQEVIMDTSIIYEADSLNVENKIIHWVLTPEGVWDYDYALPYKNSSNEN